MSTQDNDNMTLWNQVCTTPPDITKQVQQRGGFTAICAQAQLKRATELWGPYGKTWGLKDCAYEYIRDGKGDPIDLAFNATFFSPMGELFISDDIKYKPGDDCRKKVMTAARSKALSLLGFNSDVFEGKYDDNKYVQQLKQQASGGTGQAPSQAQGTSGPDPNHKEVLLQCKNIANKIRTDYKMTPPEVVTKVVEMFPSLAFFKTTKLENMTTTQLNQLKDGLEAVKDIPF